MWRRLDDDNLLDAYRHEVPGQPLLAQLLERLCHEPWAGQVSAVVSLGHFRLTTAPSHDARARHGCIGLGVKDNKIGISLHPAGVNIATDSAICTPDEAPTIVGNWMQRLLDGYSLHPLDEPTDDTDREHPTFEVGQPVRVLECGGRNTPRRGTISRAIWHKHGRWTYYLQVDGKELSKRYYGVDLAADEPNRGTESASQTG